MISGFLDVFVGMIDFPKTMVSTVRYIVGYETN